MKIGLNREYLVRHLGVAILFAALGLWFGYDAVFVYPNLPPDAPHHTSISFQYSASGLLLAAAAVIATRLWRASRETLEWNEKTMCGTLTRGREIPLATARLANLKLWQEKNILQIATETGETIYVDGWHHTNVDKLENALSAQHG